MHEHGRRDRAANETLQAETKDQLSDDLGGRLKPFMYDAVGAYLRAGGTRASVEALAPALERIIRAEVANMVNFEDLLAGQAQEELAGEVDHRLGTNYAFDILGRQPAAAFLRAWLKAHPATSRGRSRKPSHQRGTRATSRVRR